MIHNKVFARAKEGEEGILSPYLKLLRWTSVHNCSCHRVKREGSVCSCGDEFSPMLWYGKWYHVF